MHSDSNDEDAIVEINFDPHAIVPPIVLIQYPAVEKRRGGGKGVESLVQVHPAQSASLMPNKSSQ